MRRLLLFFLPNAGLGPVGVKPKIGRLVRRQYIHCKVNNQAVFYTLANIFYKHTFGSFFPYRTTQGHADKKAPNETTQCFFVGVPDPA
ncbi:MAG: hypothetical protein ICV83_27570 [Cytophagales bacterium]|nr:hypothetical protein [Cytophagales bacterium]